MASLLTRREVLGRAGGLAAALPLLSVAACEDEPAGRGRTELRGRTMGGGYAIRIARRPPGLDVAALHAGVDRRLERINDLMSTYRPDSELARFNAARSADWFAVSPETLRVVESALNLSRLSRGAFDPTVGPLVDHWGFGPAGPRARRPAGKRLVALRAEVGHRHLEIRHAPPALRKRRPDLRVDLSAIAKGYGLDAVAGYLDGLGLDHYLIEIGGELRGRGESGRGGPWRVGIEQLRARGAGVRRIVGLRNGALATSGDYLKFFEAGGRRYSHIIDPRSGRPVSHGLAAVSVIAGSAMRADALATTLMVLGPVAGLRLAEDQGLAALLLIREGEALREVATPRFDRHVIA